MAPRGTSTLTSQVFADDDPLPNESAEERQARLQREQEAQARSNAIDEELNRQRIAEKKGPKCVKLLLLGKSTTLKNFQLMNSPKAFRTERASWRAVVQLNVVRSIRLILDAVTDAQNAVRPSGSPITDTPEYPPLTPEHLKLKMRLAPLQSVEDALLRKLAPPGTADNEATHLTPLTNLPGRKELAVYGAKQWKGAFGRLLTGGERTSLDGDAVNLEDPDEPSVVLNACRDDMIQLWNDPLIRQLLKAQKLRLEDMAGFPMTDGFSSFLDSIERVTALRYVPTDDDILRARIKTLGVSEHRFRLKAMSGNMVSHDWRIFDVGGARSVTIFVAAWVPYFDDIDAIIFLAPISCFDQVLAEDSAVNRLEDSILLWKSVVGHPLLKNTSIVLFLNKIDILKQKLQAGVKFADFVVSYGQRPNTYDSISGYLQKKFAGLHKTASPQPRPFYSHFTSVTDTQSTAIILGNIKDQIVQENLKSSGLV
ncbi:guanine nucleotide-binding protein alpha-4 subunit [Flagelloscypha sp. PMI_526]|nr:guanine nucleotide-binding protein alpha-4 subunit [Flagelloscypha sp. PMI_526]